MPVVFSRNSAATNFVILIQNLVGVSIKKKLYFILFTITRYPGKGILYFIFYYPPFT